MMKKYICFALWPLYCILLLSSCTEQKKIYFDFTYDEMKEMAREENRPFCLVFSEGSCPACNIIQERLYSSRHKKLPRKALISIINTSRPENRWYPQWICLPSSPVTCVFSPSGRLSAVVEGASELSVDCIEKCVDGKTGCSDYMYGTPISRKDNTPVFRYLDRVMALKAAYEEGMDVGSTLDSLSKEERYPYLVFLQFANSRKQGREEEARRFAEELMSYNQYYYLKLYQELRREARIFLDPEYDPSTAGRLEVDPVEIRLEDCEIGESRDFEVLLRNTGVTPLEVLDVNISCTCIEIEGKRHFTIAPGESSLLKGKFTAEQKGLYTRFLHIGTDGVVPIRRITIYAHAK